MTISVEDNHCHHIVLEDLNKFWQRVDLMWALTGGVWPDT
jgi:hypothetical protein